MGEGDKITGEGGEEGRQGLGLGLEGRCLQTGIPFFPVEAEHVSWWSCRSETEPCDPRDAVQGQQETIKTKVHLNRLGKVLLLGTWAVGGQLLTAWLTAWPRVMLSHRLKVTCVP